MNEIEKESENVFSRNIKDEENQAVMSGGREHPMFASNDGRRLRERQIGRFSFLL